MSTLGERLEGLVAKWQVEHSEALSQAKGETDDQAYIGWMRLAAVTRNHMIELEAALRAEGQGAAPESEVPCNCGWIGHERAAAPSLHKEGAGGDEWLAHCISRWLLDVREGHYEPDEQTAMQIIKEVRAASPAGRVEP